MSKTRIKVNLNQDDLFCVYSKERIQINEKYVEVTEQYLGEEITQSYKLDCCPTEDDLDEDSEPWISNN